MSACEGCAGTHQRLHEPTKYTPAITNGSGLALWLCGYCRGERETPQDGPRELRSVPERQRPPEPSGAQPYDEPLPGL